MSDKKVNYIGGSVRQHIFDDGGSVINLSLRLSDLKDCFVSEKGFIRLIIGERREPDQYGNTHWCKEDPWRPDGSSSSKKGKKKETPSKAAPEPESNDDGEEDLPF